MKPTNLRLHSSASRLTSRACGQTGVPSLSVFPTNLFTSPRAKASEESSRQASATRATVCVCDVPGGKRKAGAKWGSSYS